MRRAQVVDEDELRDMFVDEYGIEPCEDPAMYDVFASGVRDSLEDEAWAGEIAAVEYDQITGQR